MKYRVANKKRFMISSFILIIMVLNLVFAVSKRFENSKLNSSGVKVLDNYSVLAADKNGNISLEENKYFKKYTFNCETEFEKVNFEENKDYINIYFKNGDISNVKLKSDKEIKDISYEKSKEKLIIRIKKNFTNNNFVQLSSNDNKKIVVLLSKLDNPFHHSVVLDAGHGGEDKGTMSGDLYEKDINLKILKLAAEELTYNGFKVTKTRDEDKLLGLSEIGRIVNTANADAFISIHINDYKESKYNGFSTYYYDPSGYQKDERLRLANIMQKELIKSDNWYDRGVFKENFQVLRESKIPCVLLECGFLTNADDREKLTHNEVLKNFGVNITKGLLNYFSVAE